MATELESLQEVDRRDKELVRRGSSNLAFPHHFPEDAAPWSCSPGMSLRDYFAAAVAGQITPGPRWTCNGSEIAERAYQIADAMLAERRKQAAATDSPPSRQGIEHRRLFPEGGG